MPYIKQKDRERLMKPDEFEKTSGEINYSVTKLLIERNEKIYDEVMDIINDYIINKGLSYQTINDIIGAISCAGFEYIRRAAPHERYTKGLEELASVIHMFYQITAAPYEDKKIEENGDLYVLL